MTYHAKVIAGGTIAIPPELLAELGIKEGDSLVIERAEDGSLIVKTYAQIVKDVQRTFRAMLPPDYSGSMVDELIAERRAEAAREEADLEEWMRTHQAQ